MRKTSILILLLFLVAPLSSHSATVYEGSWFNTTFGSTDNITFSLDIIGSSATLIVDADGFVFGGPPNPPPVTLTGPVAGDGSMMLSVFGDPTFGDMSTTIDAAGIVSGSAVNIPNPGIVDMLLTGTMTSTTVMLDYRVNFVPGSIPEFAVGVINASVVPLPAALPLFASALGIFSFVGWRARRRG